MARLAPRSGGATRRRPGECRRWVCAVALATAVTNALASPTLLAGSQEDSLEKKRKSELNHMLILEVFSEQN